MLKMLKMFFVYLFALCTTYLLQRNNFLAHCQETEESVYEKDKLCNKTWFMEHYFNRKKHIDLNMMKTTCNDTHFYHCNGTISDTPTTSMREDREHHTLYYIITFNNIRTDHSCWGYAVEMFSKYDKITHYFVTKNATKSNMEFTFRVKTNYTFRILALPNGKLFTKDWLSPGRCELEILNDIYLKMEREHTFNSCKDRLGYARQMEFAVEQCSLNEDPNNRRERLKNYMTIKDCAIIIEIESKPNKTVIALSIFALIIISLILIVVYLRKKHLRDFLLNKTSKDIAVPFDQKEQRSVIIIHRPGCEILDSLVQELRAMLMSYGINVKETLSDQDILDAEGGIASYLQRNIKNCDHVLILLTAKDTERKIQHRPYEFAVKLLEGLAVHEDKISNYIPLYLKSYYEVVHLFPSFLQASTSYGYRLPHETLRLLCKVLETATLEHSKEREAKDRIFLSYIKKFTKDYLKQQHMNCCKNFCSKGMQYPSTSNLSSIWASTVNTKWPSFESIDERENVLDSIAEQETIDKNCYEKTLKYLQGTLDVNMDNVSEHEVFLPDSEETSSLCPQRVELLSLTSSNTTVMTECKYSTQSSQSSEGIICDNQRLSSGAS